MCINLVVKFNLVTGFQTDLIKLRFKLIIQSKGPWGYGIGNPVNEAVNRLGGTKIVSLPVIAIEFSSLDS
jgi:hypothetical protein